MKTTSLLCVSFLTLSVSSAFADPAAVIDGFSCTGFVPDSDPAVHLTTTESHKVVTDKGTRLLTCHFDHDLDLDNAVGAQGFLCGVSLPDGSDMQLTNDTKMLVAPGGRAVLSCKLKDS